MFALFVFSYIDEIFLRVMHFSKPSIYSRSNIEAYLVCEVEDRFSTVEL